jgi:hypothetical protein
MILQSKSELCKWSISITKWCKFVSGMYETKIKYSRLIFIRWIAIFGVFVGIKKPRNLGQHERRKTCVTREAMSKYQNHEFKY